MSACLDCCENSKKPMMRSSIDLRLGDRRGDLVVEGIDVFSEQLPTGLVVQAVFTHQRHLSPRVQVFLEFLTAYCAQLG